MMNEYQNPLPVSPVFSQGPSPKKSNVRVIAVLAVATCFVLGAVFTLLYFIFFDQSNSRTVAIQEEYGSVEITETGLNPQTIKVKAGQQVFFKNKDVVPHRIVADPEYLDEFDSVEALETGSVYVYVFDKPGSYQYYDPQNITLVGTVQVE